jgi:hypothetical protein
MQSVRDAGMDERLICVSRFAFQYCVLVFCASAVCVASVVTAQIVHAVTEIFHCICCTHYGRHVSVPMELLHRCNYAGVDKKHTGQNLLQEN